MDVSYPPEEGDTYTVERTFTTEDVRKFASVSGDTQPIHTDPDEDGRLVVQGLLTATLPTSIGAELEVLASRMDNHFHQPVYTGETISCETTTTTVEEYDDRYDVRGENVCTNESGEGVLTGHFEGVIRKDGASSPHD